MRIPKDELLNITRRGFEKRIIILIKIEGSRKN